MKFASELVDEQEQELRQLVKTSANHRVRQRAHAILLSARGYTIENLADIFSAHRNTISEWLDLWQRQGAESLAIESLLEDAPRSGRPQSLSNDDQQALLTAIEANPRSINDALREVKKKQARRYADRSPGV